MEGGLPMLNCLLQHTLRSLCSSASPPSDLSHSSKWVYAVFWRILPRNYPPPRWDYGGSVLDRSKGNKRNWILVWEDGFCDFYECERAGSGYIKGKFGADVFFKMSHEVYNYGEGLMGKVAADNGHKWVFREITTENDPNFFSSWNGSLDVQPRVWESQFNSGIQTIVIIAVREGIIQLGSLNKITEDLNLVINIQRKFSYLQSIPGIFSMQRPYTAQSHQSNTLKMDNQMIDINHMDYLDNKQHVVTGGKRCDSQRLEESPISKSINLGWNSPQNRGVFWSVPPMLPPMSCSLGALLSKLPSVVPPNQNLVETPNSTGNTNNPGSKIVTSLGQTPALKSNISINESHSTMMNGTSNSQGLDLPETKPNTQKPKPNQSRKDPAVQLKFRAQADEESAPHELNNIIQ
ncbi:uncharacterized protein LOC131229524 [Magnolia sinica]|uniref:uncharacterized protein LOC131229524 n=1 Tax=Magnolia sinica TaxID=86752 RepID=UPI0026585DFE|nr:uncharacterized protein LOC131229524 [Magnolia sinica]